MYIEVLRAVIDVRCTLQFYKVSARSIQRVGLFVDIKIPPKVPSFLPRHHSDDASLVSYSENRKIARRPSRLHSLFIRFCTRYKSLDLSNLVKDLKVKIR